MKKTKKKIRVINETLIVILGFIALFLLMCVLFEMTTPDRWMHLKYTAPAMLITFALTNLCLVINTYLRSR